MSEAVGEHVADVLVREAVVHDPPGLAPAHDAPIAQEPQLVRERRVAATQEQGEIAHAQLVGQGEGVQQPGAGRIGEQLEDRRQVLGLGSGNDIAQEGRDVLRVEALDLAAVGH